jgi:hypothetical protein
MQSDSPDPGDSPAQEPTVRASPEPSRSPIPIADLLVKPDFPKSALGQFVDIGGYAGTVVDIVNQSLKVKSPEGITKSFNAHGLRRIYGPVIRAEPPPEAPLPSPSARPAFERELPAAVLPSVPPPIEPDFSRPVRKIGEFVRRPDYPQCLLSEHVQIAGYTGVVVQIVNKSLKVRSQAEITRSYNADALRRLHSEGAN